MKILYSPHKLYFLILIVSVLTACKGLQESSKYHFNEGYYKVKSAQLIGRAYVIPSDDSVKVYPINREAFDSTKIIELVLPQKTSSAPPNKNIFVNNSFDVDVLTILFKYRPSVKGFPNQFTTNLNGAAYVGYRSDIFRVSYGKRPLYYKRNIQHYGYSYGAFLGIGATAMNPWVTQNNISDEYDGFVITKGVALNMAFNTFTFGVAIGIETVKRLKERWPTVKVLAISADESRWQIAKMTIVGADGFITKNSSIQEWSNAIKRLFSKNDQ